MNFLHRAFLRAALLSALMAAPLAHAGRPQSTDDAATVDAQTCQFEAWVERAGSAGTAVLAPACALASGLELDAGFAQPRPHDVVRVQAGLALKWVPASWKLDSGPGELSLGLKLSRDWAKPVGAAWQAAQTSLLGLATQKLGDAWALHGNLGLARDSATATRATLLYLALAWTPADAWLLFAEVQGNNKHAVFGGTVASLGARWWLLKDRLGLDITASRESGTGGPTRWGLGLGWYGIGG